MQSDTLKMTVCFVSVYQTLFRHSLILFPPHSENTSHDYHRSYVNKVARGLHNEEIMPTAVPTQAATAYIYMKYTCLTLILPALLSNIMLGT